MSSLCSFLCCVNLRSLELGPPSWEKSLGKWKCNHEAKFRYLVGIQSFSHKYLRSSRDRRQRAQRLLLHNRFSELDSSLKAGQNDGPGYCCSACPLSRNRARFDTVVMEIRPKEPATGRPKISLKGLSVLAFTLSTVLGCEPACADFKPSGLGEASVKVEVANSSVPSVESILAKQLARRFREMSDEELADVLQQLLKASGSSLSSQVIGSDGAVPDIILKNNAGKVDEKPSARTHEEDRSPMLQKADEKVEKSNGVLDTFKWLSGSSDKQTDAKTDKKLFDNSAIRRAQEENEQRVKKSSDKSSNKPKVSDNVEKVLPPDIKTSEQIPADAELLNTQQKGSVWGIEAFAEPVPENTSEDTPETTSGEAPGTTKLEMSDTIGDISSPAESYPSEREKTADQDNGNFENIVRLIRAEWNQRLEGVNLQESDSSGLSSFLSISADVWENVQNFSLIVFTQVIVFSAWAYGGQYKIVSITTTWVVSFALAFFLGRSHAGKGTAQSKENLLKQKLPVVFSARKSRVRSRLSRSPEEVSQAGLKSEQEDSYDPRSSQRQASGWWKTQPSETILTSAAKAPITFHSLARSVPSDGISEADDGAHLDSGKMSSAEVMPKEIATAEEKDLDFRETSTSEVDAREEIGLHSNGHAGMNNLQDKTAKVGQSNGSWRESERENSSPSNGDLDSFFHDQKLSNGDLDSFFHDQKLWTRDADGVFIQEPVGKIENGSLAGKGGAEEIQDSSSRAERIMASLATTDIPSTISKDSRKRFDYRQLTVETSE